MIDQLLARRPPKGGRRRGAPTISRAGGPRKRTQCRIACARAVSDAAHEGAWHGIELHAGGPGDPGQCYRRRQCSEHPDVAALADGRFAVVYTREFASNDRDINIQFLNADGTLSGPRLLVDTDSGFQYTPAVASRPGGGAVVVWTDENGKDGAGNSIDHAIQLRVVTNAGVMSTPLTVADVPAVDYSRPDVASLGDGRILVVYQADHHRAIKTSGCGSSILQAIT